MESVRIGDAGAGGAQPGCVRESIRKLCEGEHPWGTVDVSPAGGGVWQRTNLTVYPPGTTGSERRALRFEHAWPIAGAVLSLLLLVAFASAWPAPLAFTAIALLYASGFWMGRRLTRHLRHRVRAVTTATVSVAGELQTFGDRELLRETLAELERIDALRRRGELTPVQYEAAWGGVFEKLPAPSTDARSRLAW
jgi:hypothetical protein